MSAEPVMFSEVSDEVPKPARRKPGPAKGTPRSPRSKSRKPVTPGSFPGLRDNLAKLFSELDAGTTKTMAWTLEQMPEVPLSAMRYHLYKLVDARVLINNAGAFRAAQPHERNEPTAQPQRVPQRALEVVPPRGTEPGRSPQFAARQVESIILRMENVNEITGAFTPLDFDVLRQVAGKIRANG